MMDECKASFIPHGLSASTTDRKGSVDFKEWCSYLRRGTSDRLWQDRHCVAATFQFVPFPLAPTPYTLASGQIALYKILCVFILLYHISSYCLYSNFWSEDLIFVIVFAFLEVDVFLLLAGSWECDRQCVIKARRKWFDSRLKFRRRVNGAAWKRWQI